MMKPDDKFVVVNRIVSKSPVIVFVWQNSTGWPVLFVSSNVEQFIGYTPDEFLTGKIVFADIVHPDDLERVKEEVAKYSNERGRVDYAHKPYRIITKNGQIKWFDDRTNIQRDESGNVTHYEGVLIDITEAKQTEELLKKNEEELVALTYNIPGMIYRSNRDWSVDAISNSEPICGYTSEEFLRKQVNWLDVIHPEDKTAIVLKKQGFYEKPTSIVDEYRIIAKQGLVRYVSDHKTSRFSSRGEFEGVDGIVFDVSRQKKFEQELITAKEVAEKNQAELKERVKELQGIFKLGLAFEKYDDLDIIFTEFVCDIVPKSMQFCDKVYASITIDNKFHENIKGFKIKKGKEFLSASIYAFKKVVGELVVTYTEDLPFIDIYEQSLIELYAQRISTITEKKKVQQELKLQNKHLERLNNELLKAIKRVVEGEKKFKRIFDFTSDSIVVVDDKLSVKIANRSFCNMFGYSHQEVAHLSIKALFKKYKNIDEDLLQILNGKMSIIDDIRMQRGDGSEFFAEITATPLMLGSESLALCSIRDITERKQMQQKIIRTIIETEENERKRVSQELHDGIGPILSTIKLFTETYFNSKNEDYKKEIAKQLMVSINESLEHVSIISNNLSPQVLLDFGLRVAIKKFIDKLGKASPLKIDFQYSLDSRLSNEIEITIYRVVIELINNTIKHANAQNVRIAIGHYSDGVLVEYFDDGVGFDYEKALKMISGMGLFNIQHRIKSLNGEMDFYNEGQIGIRVKARIPYSF